MTFSMHVIWQILSNTGEIWPIQMGQRSLSMALPWIQTLQLSDLCSVQNKTSAPRTWWVHSALNSVLHCETSSLVGVRSTHCTVHCASRTREGEFPQIPLSSSGNEGPASLSSSGGLAGARLLLPPKAWAILNFASLGLGSRLSTSMQCLLPSWAVHKYSKVCTSMQYTQVCNASWLQQFLPSFWSRADVATGCSHIYFEYLYTKILSIF